MAGAKEIRTKIKSVKNTQKITRAMEKVAMSKMRRAQERMLAARPYAEAIRRTMGHLANAQPEYRHQFMVDRPVKRVAYLIISTDRGLAGGINVNTFRASIRSIKEWKDKGVDADLAIVGNKGISFFKRVGGKVLATASGLGDKPTLESVFGTIKVVTDAFRNGEVDRVYVVYANFVNTMTQRPTVQQLLPIEATPATGLLKSWDYIYEPGATELLDSVLQRYIESQVYQAVIENTASEQSARMVAMKAATDNAGKIIQGLQLAYNKARQASITKELAEIVGGAAAV
ncbi:F-type H+-transporting ATPase subunit gamma [Hydrocarboniphaga daqingensis]|jgi:F-type H+-transporting ATPase subunit gamma|uniref:ATP synthase gamma chain n=1 Tax=Hydrocarboniphaga daqingensis TaxID=490188 RepID=A0A1M5MU63_9GAMM|nr:F0F1 ATP synthase subunit gamma [Hydrocarboniphaga daqingensis]SHG80697.1 F-type H+-transporting ATPase subunit gamma [Hydrocarboniphaga daqingensis]